jgi:hypothetical protein
VAATEVSVNASIQPREDAQLGVTHHLFLIFREWPAQGVIRSPDVGIFGVDDQRSSVPDECFRKVLLPPSYVDLD